MPISKKDRIQREHKKLDALGLRAPVKANGNPVKAAKPTTLCTICKGTFRPDLASQMVLHVNAKHDKSTFAICFPGITPP
ncbi:hypothetical protein BDY24DRAFT_404126 [Mrakia frigida]|uniref:uncharacterized protein n=1 Tax=Mrakia frigida TaxID=29902 RepID=UPI003FCC1B77